MSVITVENLRYRYPHAKELALDGLDFSVEKGEFIGIIGENGAGKSTLSQALMGLVPQFYKGAYGGTVMVDGIEAGRTPVAQLCGHVGLVFQNPFNQLSGAKDNVYEEVAFGMQNLGVPAEEMKNRVEEALKLLDIWQYRDRNPFDLSGGQMQRVAIASVLVMRPDVMILDEPTSYLDIRHKLELLNTLKKLVREKNTAVLMSLHELDLALRVSDKIVCIDGGKVGRVGTPEEIFSGGYISALYGISEVCFCESSGCAELEKPAGAPEVFVISGGGNSGGVFRRLQRAGTPFAAGIIPANDIDLPAARALAAEVISRPAFSEASQEAVQRGLRLIGECGGVICCPGSCGALNPENSELLSCARRLGKLISDA